MVKHYSMFIVYECDMCGEERNATTDRFGIEGMDKVVCSACLKIWKEAGDDQVM